MNTYVKAYLAGSFRDGYIGFYMEKNGKKHFVARIYSKDIEWLQTLANLVKQAYNVEMKLIIPRKGTPYIEKYDKSFVKTIAREYGHPLGKQYNWETPGFIVKSRDKELWRAYITGFFDAEGGVDIVKKQIKFYQSWDGEECPPLLDIKKALEEIFHIETGNVSKYTNKNGKYPRFVLRIKKKYTIKFIHEFTPLNTIKRNKINTLILTLINTPGRQRPQNSSPAEAEGPEDWSGLKPAAETPGHGSDGAVIR